MHLLHLFSLCKYSIEMSHNN